MRKSLLLTFVLLVASTCSAFAGIGDIVDIGSMQLDTDYTLNGDFSDYTGSFEAPKSGTLTVTATSSGCLMTPYSDADCTQQIDYNFSYTDTGVTYDIPVEAGTRYYFYKNFCMGSGVMRLTMEDNVALTLTGTSPEAGSALSTGGAGTLSFTFNKAVNVSSGQLVSGGHTYPLTVNTLGTSAIIDYKEALMAAYGEGTVEGDAVTVRLEGVCINGNASVMYDGTGILEVAYTAAPKPVCLVSTSGMGDGRFLSYWVTGDTAAVLTMTFDGPILSGETATTAVRLAYGDIESETGDYYTEDIPFTVDGNRLSMDFSGKLRRPQDMVTSGTNYGTMSLRVLNVRDAQGNYVYSDIKGALGSFGFAFDYKEVETNIISEFTPASGSQLTGTDSIEVWIADYANVRHEGFKFSYTLDGTPCERVVTDYSSRPDTDYEGAWIFMIPVVDDFNGHAINDIVLALNNPTFLDGLDHSADVRATYSLDLTSISNIGSADRTATWHDLSGRRTDRPVRGIYIRDGRKVLVK